MCFILLLRVSIKMKKNLTSRGENVKQSITQDAMGKNKGEGIIERMR